MRVLHLLPNLCVGGAERFLSRLAPRLKAEYGVEQQVAAFGRGGEEIPRLLQNDGIEVVTSQLPSWAIPVSALWARKAILKFQPDIIQTWLYRSDLLGALLRGGSDAKLVWNLRCSDMALPLHNRIERSLCSALSSSSPDAIIACGERARAYHIGLGYEPEKMQVIGNGYHLDNLPSLEALGRRQAISGKVRIGAAGRYDTVKGYDILIEATKKLVNSGVSVDLVIAGRRCDDNNSALLTIIDQAGLRDSVKLLGEISDMSNFYSGVDIFCLSSLSEGFPNVLCEAMAHGLPVVTTDAGDAKEIVAGLAPVVKPGESEPLFLALRDLVEMDPLQRYELGKRGAEHIRSTYSISAISEQYYHLYSELTGKPVR